jgi:hypothetical protein
MSMSSEPVYEIVSPLGADLSHSGGIAPAPSLRDFDGRRIGLIWTEFTNGNVLLEAFESLLGKRFPSLQFVKMAPGRNTEWGGSPDPTLTDLVREQRIDAAIITAGC